MVVKSKICIFFDRIISVKKNKNGLKHEVLSHFYGADDRDRTGTGIASRGILSRYQQCFYKFFANHYFFICSINFRINKHFSVI